MSALLALAASLLWGSSDFGGGLLSRHVNSLATVYVSQGFALLGLLALFPLATMHGGSYLLIAGAAGVAGSIALAAFYRALATAPMSLVAPISASGAVIPVLVGLIRGEALSPLQAAGIGVALLGVVLASGPELRSGAPVRRQALLFAVLAGAGFGAVYALLALSADHGLYGTLLLQRIGGLVILGPAALRPSVLRTIRPDSTIRSVSTIRPASTVQPASTIRPARTVRPASTVQPASIDRYASEAPAGRVPQAADGPVSPEPTPAPRPRFGSRPRLALTLRLAALAAVGTCDISANGAYAAAAGGGHIAVAAVLASLYPVVTALLARFLLAERLRPVQTIGVLAALAGVLLLSTL
jgi:drug/metabolite transporter (DMT)-like permease